MEPLTTEQLQAKVLFLEQENSRLRSQNLDLQIRAGHIKLKEEPADG